MKIGIIYAAVNKISGSIYIGRTTKSLSERIRGHYYDSQGHTYAFANALKKYAKNDWDWRVLYNDIPWEQLSNMEKWCIANYNTYHNGYNSTLGGEACPMDYLESRIKLSKSKTGQKRPDMIEKIKEINKNRVYTAEARQSISDRTSGENNPMFNKHHTEEVKLSISINHGSKPFIVFKDGVIVGEWTNKKECSRALKIDNSVIKKYLDGKNKNSLGYVFKYK